jgi:hypothetical protein
VNPREIAAKLLEGGLTNPTLLNGDRGLRYFEAHGLTPQNQEEVIALTTALHRRRKSK